MYGLGVSLPSSAPALLDSVAVFGAEGCVVEDRAGGFLLGLRFLPPGLPVPHDHRMDFPGHRCLRDHVPAPRTPAPEGTFGSPMGALLSKHVDAPTTRMNTGNHANDVHTFWPLTPGRRYGIGVYPIKPLFTNVWFTPSPPRRQPR